MDVGKGIRIGLAAGAALTATGAIALAGTVQAGPPLLLPDLKTASPGQDALQLRVGQKGERVILRVSNVVANGGEGPMELYSTPATTEGGPGDDTDCTDGEYEEPVGADRDANQRIYEDTDGSGDFDPKDDAEGSTEKVGCFEYHAAHDHWHFQDFAQFRLETAAGEPIPGIQPSRKIGFCIFDNRRSYPELGSNQSEYSSGGCNQGNTEEGPERLGLSVGWGDLYDKSLPGQRIDISGVTRGNYCLVSIANPPDPPVNPPPFRSDVVESDDANNDRRRLIRINPDRDKAEFLKQAC